MAESINQALAAVAGAAAPKNTSATPTAATRTKRSKPRVDNTGATGNEKIYRTKAYTYVETNGKITRVKGATPIEGVSVIHGPPPQQKLAEINKSSAKSKKINLTTSTLLILCGLLVIQYSTYTLASKVAKKQCYSTGAHTCVWIGDRTPAISCPKCEWIDDKQHLIVGSNGYDGNWNRLVYINSTTGKVNEGITIGRLAPLLPGTLLWEMYERFARSSTPLDSYISDKFDEFQRKTGDEINSITHTLDTFKLKQSSNFDTSIKLHEELDGRMQSFRKELHDTLIGVKQQVVENSDKISTIRVDVNRHVDNTLKQSGIKAVEAALASTQRLQDQVKQLQMKITLLEDSMQHLVMDAVNSLLKHKNEVSVDYGVHAMSTPPLVRTVRDANKGDEDSTSRVPIRINYGFKTIELNNNITKHCSCTNGVLKMCNIEVKFNTSRSYKSEESTYCVVQTDISKGTMSKRERLICKQSEIRDACSLSILIGKPIDFQNVTVAKIFDKKVFVNDEQFIYDVRMINDMCNFADENRPYKLTPTSKYRPIFIACNITLPDPAPKRNTNRLHYLVSTMALLITFVAEVIYESWISGVEILIAAIVAFLFVVEDALISENISVRNYATLTVLICCFTAVTMNKVTSLIVYVGIMSWLYTVEAIDGMTFNVVGTQTPNKIIYETSLNMHTGDVIMMGNASLTMRQIRQRKEYDYAYTVPKFIAYKQLCHNWDCTNTAPNCKNKCDGQCDQLKYKRCSAMSMYNSCVWSPLRCALCEGTGALYETLCFTAVETCNIFDSPSNQGEREIVLNYNIDGRTEEHVVKVGQDAYASGGVFKITELEILETEPIGSVAKCGDHTWCRKQKLQLKDFCGWYGMESNASQLEPACLRIKDTRSYADGHSLSSKLEYRNNNFEPTQFGYRECTRSQVNSDDVKSAVVWTQSPGARLNIYHEQELDSVTTQLCDDIESLTVSSVVEGEKHAFKVSIISIVGTVEQECLAYISSKYCYVLGRSDYLLRSEFNINITMTCTIWSSDVIYVSGNKRYEVSAANIAVDPNYYIEKAWSINTNNNTISGSDIPIEIMKWILESTRWLGRLISSVAQNVFAIIAVVILVYAVTMLHDGYVYIGVVVAMLVGLVGYARAEDYSDETHGNYF